MKQFLSKLFLFILPWIILAYPIDIFLSKLLQESNEPPGEYEVWNDIYARNLDAELAIYGSSRAWVHINPETLSKATNLSAYNFGIDGHNFWMQYLRHLEFLKHNKKPDLILLSVDVYTFQKEPNLYYKEQFLPYMLWNKNIRKYTSSYKGYSFFDYTIPLVRYAGEREILKKCSTLLFNKSTPIKYRDKGFKGMERNWNKDFDNAKAMTEFYTVEIHEPSIELFYDFVNECENLDIDLVMVYTPEHVLGQDYIANREEIFDIFNQAAEERNIPFLDYSTLDICSDTSYFYNASHLNLKGTEIFNAALGKDLLQLGIDH